MCRECSVWRMEGELELELSDTGPVCLLVTDKIELPYQLCFNLKLVTALLKCV
jgi:hypothetical protein